VEQRKATSYLANGHIWAPYCSARSKWVFARPRVLIAAIGAAAEDASPCQTMLRGYLRLLGDGWPSSQRLPHIHQVSKASVIAARQRAGLRQRQQRGESSAER
jgi:hypothetical protein